MPFVGIVGGGGIGGAVGVMTYFFFYRKK